MVMLQFYFFICRPLNCLVPDTITHHCVDACLSYSNLCLLPKNTEHKLSEEISNYDTVGDNIYFATDQGICLKYGPTCLYLYTYYIPILPYKSILG